MLSFKRYSLPKDWNYIPLLIGLYWLWPKHFARIPSIGLDWSWILSLHYAYANKLIFGKEWVFTYGPLGWLSTRADYLLNQPLLLGFDLVKMTLFGIVIQYFIERSKVYKYGLFLVMYGVFILSLLPDLMIELLFLFQFFLYLFHTEKKYSYLFVAVWIGVMMFFIKLNYAFIGSLLLGTYLFLASIHTRSLKTKLVYLGIMIGYVLTIIIFSQLLHVDLLGYLKASIEVISGYNDGMNIYNQYQINYTRRALPPVLMASAITLAVWIGGILYFKVYLKNWFDGFLYVCTSISFYLIYKHAFTFYTDGPASEFFTTAPAWLSLIWFFTQNDALQKVSLKAIVLVLLVVPVGLASFWVANPMALPYNDAILYSSVEKEVYQADQKKHSIDSTAIKELSKGTVDVFPTNLDIAFYNELNYKPRPVILGYKAYTPQLQHLNAEFFTSDHKPDYVLYELSKLEHFHLDAQSRLALTRAYQIKKEIVTKAGDSLLVLEKRKGVQPLHETLIEKKQTRVNEWCKLTTYEGMGWLTCQVDYTIWGKLRRFLFQPPRLYLEVEYADHTIEKRPAVPPCLPSGFPLQRLNSKQEQYEWFENGGKKNTPIVAFRFTTEEAGFKDTILYGVKSYTLTPQ